MRRETMRETKSRFERVVQWYFRASHVAYWVAGGGIAILLTLRVLLYALRWLFQRTGDRSLTASEQVIEGFARLTDPIFDVLVFAALGTVAVGWLLGIALALTDGIGSLVTKVYGHGPTETRVEGGYDP